MAATELKEIRLLLLDVDGVLTDGRLIFQEAPSEAKVFHVRDGLGLRMLISAGVQVGIVTARRSEAVRRRCNELGIDLVLQGLTDKCAALKTAAARTGVPPEATAFIGDDLPDLALMSRVGLSAAVADAAPEVVKSAALVLTACGGGGEVHPKMTAPKITRSTARKKT